MYLTFLKSRSPPAGKISSMRRSKTIAASFSVARANSRMSALRVCSAKPSVWDCESVDGSVNEHDFPIIAGFLEERRVHAGSFIDAIIDGIGEGSPCGVAPSPGRDVMDAHFPLWRRGHLAVDEIQGEHLAR